jgi:nucleotide-binding universal stress UspA family protein
MLKLIVAYDFTELAEMSLTQAAAIGAQFAPVELHAVAVLDGSLTKRGLIDKPDYANAERLRDRLASVIEALPSRFQMPDAKVFAHVRVGSADDEILDLAREIEADMIFVGTHGATGVKRLLLGSVAESIVRHAHCPVVVARPKDYEPAEEGARPEPAGGPTADHRVEPHVYSYKSPVAPTRPPAWPLY